MAPPTCRTRRFVTLAFTLLTASLATGAGAASRPAGLPASLVEARALALSRAAHPARAQSAPFVRPAQSAGFMPGEVLVILPANATFARGGHGEPVAGDAKRAQLFTRNGLVPARLLARRGGALAGRLAVLRSADPNFDPVSASATLRASGLVRAAVPNFRLSLHNTTPNDLYVPDQWYVNQGVESVRLPQAWDNAKGDTSTVIAILDTGVDLGHPDLASQIAVNWGEIPGNSLDDDNNGFVDDVRGWDFGDDDSDPNPEPLIDEIGLDEGFHGTFCAGIAAGATNNSIGIAGSGWKCRILPLRVADANGEITGESLAEAVLYAIDRQVDVMSMSLGTAEAPGIPEFFQPLMDAAHDAGIVCVASAGNDGADALSYPAACDHVVAVAATNDAGQRSEFSNFGSWVDVCAPGEFMLSTLCRNYEIDELSQIFYLYFFLWDGENPYMYGDGTSFACPLTAGVCGLMRAKNPALSADAIVAHLIATGDEGFYDQPIGPKINAFAATNAVTTDVAASGAGLVALAAPVPNPSAAGAHLAFTLPVAGDAELAVFDPAGRRVRTLAAGEQAAGTHRFFWDGTDAIGARTPAGLYFARLTAFGATATTRLVRLDR